MDLFKVSADGGGEFDERFQPAAGGPAQHSKASITACLPGHSRTRTQRTAILAAAHLRLGEVDQASQLGSQIVTAAWQLRSGHVDEEVAFLARSIERTHASGTQGVLDAADEYLAAQRV